jgi:hypothetical protein
MPGKISDPPIEVGGQDNPTLAAVDGLWARTDFGQESVTMIVHSR